MALRFYGAESEFSGPWLFLKKVFVRFYDNVQKVYTVTRGLKGSGFGPAVKFIVIPSL